MSLRFAAEQKRFTKQQRETTWELPTSVVGRYVRIQLENRSFLHLAQVEVFGEWHDVNVPRKVKWNMRNMRGRFLCNHFVVADW